MANGKIKLKKLRKPFVTKLKNIAVLCLLGYAVVVFISQQVTLNEKKSEIDSIKEKIHIAQQSNDEYTSLVNMSDDKDYIVRIAVENFNYAYPGEIRVYDKK